MGNGDSEQCPAYFDGEFLKGALRRGFKRDDLELVDYDIRLASLGGENYSSSVYRAKVNYRLDRDKNGKKHEISLILKDMRKEIEESMVMKTKEPEMYMEVIPELERILGGHDILAPKLFLTDKYNTEVFVLEDFTPRGFITKDRAKGLDEKDCVLVFKKIARFHAASMVFADKFPEVIEKIKDHTFKNGTNISSSMVSHVKGMFESTYETVAEWEGYESIAAKIKNILSTIHERIIEVFDDTKCRYKVIGHGDFWTNNILISDDDVVLIDFQLSYYGSAAADIHYFFNTSIPTDLLKLKRYEFLRIYYKEFHATLKRINHRSIPTWEDFVHEVRRMEFSGLWILVAVAPLLVLDKEASKGTDINVLQDDEGFKAKRQDMFGSKILRERLKYALDRFNEMGVLE